MDLSKPPTPSRKEIFEETLKGLEVAERIKLAMRDPFAGRKLHEARPKTIGELNSDENAVRSIYDGIAVAEKCGFDHAGPLAEDAGRQLAEIAAQRRWVERTTGEGQKQAPAAGPEIPKNYKPWPSLRAIADSLRCDEKTIRYHQEAEHAQWRKNIRQGPDGVWYTSPGYIKNCPIQKSKRDAKKKK